LVIIQASGGGRMMFAPLDCRGRWLLAGAVGVNLDEKLWAGGHANEAAQQSPGRGVEFIGREAELAEVRGLVGGSRLVTLTGAGGAGKTRLGLQVAARLADGTGEGVWFADLAPLGDSDLVAVTVADVLGVRVEPGRPALESVVEAVGGRSLLVLLDNCEHLIGACAKLADALLRGCPNITLLATSREPLGIDGERVYRVPSLGTPADSDGPGAIRASEAVRLLADRAAAQGVALAWDEPAAQVAGRICRRLDGIPLAIELAAARLRVMPAAELDTRLDQRFAILTGGPRAGLPRQQTLRAMVDWSWELLTGPEQAVLARLSVFAGGFVLAAAETVAAGPDVPAGEVLRHLGALVDKSLVQFGDAGAGPVPAAGNRPPVRRRAAGSPRPGGRGSRPGRAPRLLPGPGRGGCPPAGGARSGRLVRPARRRAGQPAGRDRVQPGPARPRTGPAAGRLSAEVLASPWARRRSGRCAARTA
jgi:predicted ATPase